LTAALRRRETSRAWSRLQLRARHVRGRLPPRRDRLSPRHVQRLLSLRGTRVRSGGHPMRRRRRLLRRAVRPHRALRVPGNGDLLHRLQ